MSENAVKKDRSLGAWPETWDAVQRLSQTYGYSRVKMLDFIVKAFDELSAQHGHGLRLPVVWENTETKTFNLPRGATVAGLSAQAEPHVRKSRSASEDAGRNLKPKVKSKPRA